MKKIGKIIHKSRSEITGFCNNHKKIYIYGAGMIGVSMAQYLKEEGINFESYLVKQYKPPSGAWET